MKKAIPFLLALFASACGGAGEDIGFDDEGNEVELGKDAQPITAQVSAGASGTSRWMFGGRRETAGNGATAWQGFRACKTKSPPSSDSCGSEIVYSPKNSSVQICVADPTLRGHLQTAMSELAAAGETRFSSLAQIVAGPCTTQSQVLVSNGNQPGRNFVGFDLRNYFTGTCVAEQSVTATFDGISYPGSACTNYTYFIDFGRLFADSSPGGPVTNLNRAKKMVARIVLLQMFGTGGRPVGSTSSTWTYANGQPATVPDFLTSGERCRDNNSTGGPGFFLTNAAGCAND